MKKIVVDSFVFIAYLRQEKGYLKFKRLLEGAKNKEVKLFLCWLNLGEIYYKVWRKKGREAAQKTLSLIEKLPIELVSVNDELVLQAAEIKAQYSISLADCFVAALARNERTLILTADPEFKKLKGLVSVEWLR